MHIISEPKTSTWANQHNGYLHKKNSCWMLRIPNNGQHWYGHYCHLIVDVTWPTATIPRVCPLTGFKHRTDNDFTYTVNLVQKYLVKDQTKVVSIDKFKSTFKQLAIEFWSVASFCYIETVFRAGSDCTYLNIVVRTDLSE